MLVQPDGQLLIAYYSGDYHAGELELKWKEGVGCCGMAWANKGEYVTVFNTPDNSRCLIGKSSSMSEVSFLCPFGKG